MFEAAGAADGDPLEVKHQKLRAWWMRVRRDLTCNTSDFEVRGGSILKYSVRARSFQFLNTVMEIWKLDVNFIDRIDGRTILDYLNDEVRRNAGNEQEAELTEYRDMLLQHGAKTAAQIRAGGGN